MKICECWLICLIQMSTFLVRLGLDMLSSDTVIVEVNNKKGIWNLN